MQARRPRPQGGAPPGRSLHRPPLVVEAQPVEAAQFLAIAGAAGPPWLHCGMTIPCPVCADAIAGSTTSSRLVYHPRKKSLILPVDRRHSEPPPRAMSIAA